jgi:hypothetical protein
VREPPARTSPRPRPQADRVERLLACTEAAAWPRPRWRPPRAWGPLAAGVLYLAQTDDGVVANIRTQARSTASSFKLLPYAE